MNANFSPDQGPKKIPFLSEKIDPYSAIRGNMEISGSNMPALYLNRLIANDDSPVALLLSGECEVVCCT